MQIEFESEVTLWDARTESWFFATLPEDLSGEIRELPAPRRGFGSLRVQARIGLTVWTTSIFFNGSAFVLPLKKQVRQAQAISAGDVITVDLDILDV